MLKSAKTLNMKLNRRKISNVEVKRVHIKKQTSQAGLYL